MNRRQAQAIVDERAIRLRLPSSQWLQPREDDTPEFSRAVTVLLAETPFLVPCMQGMFPGWGYCMGHDSCRIAFWEREDRKQVRRTPRKSRKFR